MSVFTVSANTNPKTLRIQLSPTAYFHRLWPLLMLVTNDGNM